MNQLTFLLICVSISVCLARWNILEPLKEKIISIIPRDPDHLTRKSWLEKLAGRLFYCSQCIGFWVGVIITLITGIEWLNFGYGSFIISGFISSMLATLFDFIIYNKMAKRT